MYVEDFVTTAVTTNIEGYSRSAVTALSAMNLLVVFFTYSMMNPVFADIVLNAL
jgi:hypothetical protein